MWALAKGCLKIRLAAVNSVGEKQSVDKFAHINASDSTQASLMLKCTSSHCQIDGHTLVGLFPPEKVSRNCEENVLLHLSV